MWSVAQAALNLAYTPPPFEIATRVPFTLNTMFVVMMYSPGIPILFLVAAISLTTSYWVDKYARAFLWGVEFLRAPCFWHLACDSLTRIGLSPVPPAWTCCRPVLRMYSRPPRIDHRVPEVASELMPLALVVHLLASIWL